MICTCRNITASLQRTVLALSFLRDDCYGCAGSDKAVTQLEAGKAMFDIAGYISFLLWRSVYVTKQVPSQYLLTFLLLDMKTFGSSLAPADESVLTVMASALQTTSVTWDGKCM